MMNDAAIHRAAYAIALRVLAKIPVVHAGGEYKASVKSWAKLLRGEKAYQEHMPVVAAALTWIRHPEILIPNLGGKCGMFDTAIGANANRELRPESMVAIGLTPRFRDYAAEQSSIGETELCYNTLFVGEVLRAIIHGPAFTNTFRFLPHPPAPDAECHE